MEDLNSSSSINARDLPMATTVPRAGPRQDPTRDDLDHTLAGDGRFADISGADAFPADNSTNELVALSARLSKWNEIRTNSVHLSLEKLFQQLTMFK